MDLPGGTSTPAVPSLDGLQVLSYAAAISERISLGIGVIVLPRRNPVSLARDLASIDHLSQGRLRVGVGLGVGDPRDEMLGFPSDRRVRRLTEGVSVMRALWTQDVARHDGQIYSFSGVHSQPKPMQQSGPPIWLGARAPTALKRAARIADGWIGAGSSSGQDFAEQAVLLREAIDAEGRDPTTFPMAKRVYVAVEPNERRARARMSDLLEAKYQRPGMGALWAVCGPVERCAADLEALIESGATELILNPLYDELVQIDALAEVKRMLGAQGA